MNKKDVKIFDKVYLFCIELENFLGKYAPCPYEYDETGPAGMAEMIQQDLVQNGDLDFVKNMLTDIIDSGDWIMAGMAGTFLGTAEKIAEGYFLHDLENELEEAVEKGREFNDSCYAVKRKKSRKNGSYTYCIVSIGPDLQIAPVNKRNYKSLEECRNNMPGIEITYGRLVQIRDWLRETHKGKSLSFQEIALQSMIFLQKTASERKMKKELIKNGVWPDWEQMEEIKTAPYPGTALDTDWLS